MNTLEFKNLIIPFKKDEIVVFIYNHFGEFYGFKKWSKVKYIGKSTFHDCKLTIKTNSGDLWAVPVYCLKSVKESITHRYKNWSDGTIYDTWEEDKITEEYLYSQELSDYQTYDYEKNRKDWKDIKKKIEPRSVIYTKC